MEVLGNQTLKIETQSSKPLKKRYENTTRNGKWTPEEDDCLRKAVELFGEKRWKQISTKVPGRNPLQCLHRWTKILRPGLIKGSWSAQENELLREWVRINGPQRWSDCSLIITGRSGKQCREHWFNKLNPELKRGNWTTEEDELIFQLYQKYGTSWSKIEKHLPGRTENAIKNRFYSTLRRILPKDGSKKIKKEDIQLPNFKAAFGECMNAESDPNCSSDWSYPMENNYHIDTSYHEESYENAQTSYAKAYPETQLTDCLAKLPQAKFSGHTMKYEDVVSYNQTYDDLKGDTMSPLEHDRTWTGRKQYEIANSEIYDENDQTVSTTPSQQVARSPVNNGYLRNDYEMQVAEDCMTHYNQTNDQSSQDNRASVQDLFLYPYLAKREMNSPSTQPAEPESIKKTEEPKEVAKETATSTPAAAGNEQKLVFMFQQLKRLEELLEVTKKELITRYTELAQKEAKQEINNTVFDNSEQSNVHGNN